MNTPARPRRETVRAPVVLDPGVPQRTLAFIARLRDLHGDTVEVAWEVVLDRRLDTSMLHHLPPPTPAPGTDPPDAVRRWRAAHAPAQCYYRRGPDFIQIRDVRQAESAARFLLDDPVPISAFTRCLFPSRLPDLTPDERAAAQDLVDERLLLRLDDWVVTLPYRMRRWPVPSQFA